MITNLEVFNLIARLYDDKVGADPAAWDILCTVDGSYSALKRLEGTDVLIFRGSTSALDWVQDLDDAAQMEDTPDFGGVHPGFLCGVRAVQSYWDAHIGPNAIICGHSLGAGHATLYAAHLVNIGKPPQRVVLAGCPRPGSSRIRDILKDIDIDSYRNQSANGSAHDLVTDVPFSIPLIDPYVEPRAFTPVTGIPKSDDDWGPFRWHHFELYQEGLLAIHE